MRACVCVRCAELQSLVTSAEHTTSRPTSGERHECAPVHKCSTGYDLEGASSKLMMLDSGCWGPPEVGAPAPCDSEDAPAPPAGLGAEDEEEEEGSRPPGRSGCVSVRTSSSSSSSSSSMLGQADWSSTRFRRSFRALRASCLEGRADGGRSERLASGVRLNNTAW